MQSSDFDPEFVPSDESSSEDEDSEASVPSGASTLPCSVLTRLCRLLACTESEDDDGGSEEEEEEEEVKERPKKRRAGAGAGTGSGAGSRSAPKKKEYRSDGV